MVDFAVLADQRVKVNKSKRRIRTSTMLDNLKKNKQKQNWNMNMTIIPILLSALGTVTKELIQG